MKNRAVPNISEEDKALVKSLILYEDEFMFAFNKPTGLASQTRGNRGRNLDHLLWALARSNGKRPRMVHRLDSGTSGVIVAAKTKPAAVMLSTLFETRKVKKTYLAIVSGQVPASNQGVVDAPLKASFGRPARSEIDGSGRPAITRWTVLERGASGSLFEVTPLTGRMHQIRAHLSHLGCPIVGDPIYGGAQASRLMLHAKTLALPIPGQEEVIIEAPVPGSFHAVH